MNKTELYTSCHKNVNVVLPSTILGMFSWDKVCYINEMCHFIAPSFLFFFLHFPLLYFIMGFCQRCGEITSGKCGKCGGRSVRKVFLLFAVMLI